MGLLDEEYLLKLAESANDVKRVNWEEIDDLLTTLQITEGDFFTHTFAIMYMCITNTTQKLSYKQLRKSIKDRFIIRGSGYTKTGSMEASRLWKEKEKEIRKFLKEYKRKRP